MKTKVLEHIKSKKYQPQDKSEIARALGIDPQQKAELRQILKSLIAEGILIEGRSGRYLKREESRGLMKGYIYLRPSGGGVFAPDFKDAQTAGLARTMEMTESSRVSIYEEQLATSLHGDVVLCQVVPGKPRRPYDPARHKRSRERHEDVPPEGRVIKVLERKSDCLTGTFHVRGKFAWVSPDDPLMPPVIEISARRETQAEPGHKVVVRVDEWTTRTKNPRGSLVKSFGPADAPGVDMLCLIQKYQLPVEFPAEVLQEAERLPIEVEAGDIAGREDWREREVITIDPFDARDFDDAICVTPLPDGGWELAVHIADVSHYVLPGTALDREARSRGNSVYLADRVIPMLPERISNGLCSLRPNETKLARAAIMTFDKNGRRHKTRFAMTVIRSQHRFTYEQAYEDLKAGWANRPQAEKNPLTAILLRAWDLASTLRKRRFAHGALDLDFPEIKVVLDAQGRPLRLTRVEHDESHQLIEECMLAANEAVAEHIRHANHPCVFRIHEDPATEKLAELRGFFLSHQIPCGDLAVIKELQRVINLINMRPDAPVLKLALLKSLKRAAYHPDPLGHYGLAMANYTHFTSPIRRYADLLVHRAQAKILFQAKYPTPDYAKIKEVAEHISTTERTAADAENESRRIKELAYFENLVSLGNPPSFKASVMRVNRAGLFVELAEVLTRGFVKAEEFGTMDVTYDGAMERFLLPKQQRYLRAGDIIDVIPIGVEKERRTVAFRLPPPPGSRKKHGGR